jgi:hypothetical protein
MEMNKLARKTFERCHGPEMLKGKSNFAPGGSDTATGVSLERLEFSKTGYIEVARTVADPVIPGHMVSTCQARRDDAAGRHATSISLVSRFRDQPNFG